MSNTIEVKVPDIGDFGEVDVIEVLVAEGDTVEVEQSLITVESDKASMEIPSSGAGVVKALKTKVGDKVSEGSVIVVLEAREGAESKPEASAQPDDAKADAPAKPDSTGGAAAPDAEKDGAGAGASAAAATAPAKDQGGKPVTVVVPDIGDFGEVDVIEVLVAEGDTVEAEQSLITVESDKASMEVPSSHAGVVAALKVKVGDKVSEGSAILELTTGQGGAASTASPPAEAAAPDTASASADAAPSSGGAPAADRPASGPAVVNGSGDQLASAPVARSSPTAAFADTPVPSRNLPHASPSVRKFARELGVDLTLVKGSGDKNRITHDDVRGFVKRSLASGAPAAASAGGEGFSVLAWPKVDFTKFGPIESRPLSRIKKLSGANLHRNWVMIPHVTNNDEADITDLEALRVTLNKENQKTGPKVTLLAFLIKAVVAGLKKFPEFNASLDGDNLVLKQYYHIGFAADTPNGLVVPVLRDADKKGVLEIADETAQLARLARDGKLSPAQMQGGCFSISSLGGIGGTSFTPIINAPEVAILGVSRSAHKPVWNGTGFEPRLMVPLSLSYDHRVIDGALAARFNAYLVSLLADFRRIIL